MEMMAVFEWGREGNGGRSRMERGPKSEFRTVALLAKLLNLHKFSISWAGPATNNAMGIWKWFQYRIDIRLHCMCTAYELLLLLGKSRWKHNTRKSWKIPKIQCFICEWGKFQVHISRQSFSHVTLNFSSTQ